MIEMMRGLGPGSLKGRSSNDGAAGMESGVVSKS